MSLRFLTLLNGSGLYVHGQHGDAALFGGSQASSLISTLGDQFSATGPAVLKISKIHMPSVHIFRYYEVEIPSQATHKQDGLW